ncbi:MAG: hypothetical protein J0M08_01495 [Bacteroidetes bacterium]|nr:hypothetical protein [Bacteroidota bacterium]
MQKINTLLVFIFITTNVFCQEDLLSLVEPDAKSEALNEKVSATFKTTKIINAQTTESVKKNTLDFRITHRFGNMGEKSNGGVHTLWGLDNSNDIRFSFDYGITDKLAVGIARSKMNELIDGSIKFRFLEQKKKKMPISAALFLMAGYNPQRSTDFYAGTVGVIENKAIHRISYTSQLIIASKLSDRISIEILPTYVHRNFVKRYINPDNGKEDENGILSVGFGGRIKITKRFCLLADYFYVVSDYRTKNPTTPFYNPLAVGFEVETGGHVFHVDFTNATGIVENNFIPFTNDTWTKGGYKLGFNISRVFNF